MKNNLKLASIYSMIYKPVEVSLQFRKVNVEEDGRFRRFTFIAS